MFERLKGLFKSSGKRGMMLPNIAAYYVGATPQAGAGWINQLRSKDEEIRRDAMLLRSNARRLANNNPIMRQFLRLISDGTAGPKGCTFQSTFSSRKSGTRRDPYANKIEDVFGQWAKSATADGKSDFAAVQRQWMKTIAMDGEAFIRIIRGYSGNKYGFALQWLDADLLDHNYSVVAGQGRNAVIQGVEVDLYGRPAAYWFTDPELINYRQAWGAGPKVRIPAEDIIHGFDPERCIQTRGTSWVAPSMYLLSLLGSYWESEVAAAHHESQRLGLLKDTSGSLENDDDRDLNTNLDPMMAARSMPRENGIFYQGVPAGLDIEFPNLQHPNTAFDGFSKAILKLIAAGMGVAYSDLTGDLTSVSFSSIRQGILQQRDFFRECQALLVGSLCERVANEFLFAQVFLTGQIALPAGVTFEKFSTHQWEPRGFDWVDPVKDTQSKIESIGFGLDSRTRVCAEKGVDFVELCNQLKAEQDLIDKLGLNIGALAKPPAAAGPGAQEAIEPKDDGDGKDTEKTKKDDQEDAND